MTRIAGLIGLVLVFAGSLPAAAVHDGHDEGPTEYVFTIGKNGDVKIGSDVKIGDALVKKGKYLVAHRVEGDSHILVLTGIDGKKTDVAPVHEILMRLIPARNPVKKSAMSAKEQSDHLYRVTIVQIAGENGDHIPETSATNQPLAFRSK